MNLEDHLTRSIEAVRQAHGHIDARTFARHLIAEHAAFTTAEAAQIEAEKQAIEDAAEPEAKSKKSRSKTSD